MATPATSNKTPAQMFALVFGVVYLLVGIVGFFVGGKFTGGTDGDKLIIFHINYLHDIIHLVLGVVWIGASRTHAMAKQVNTLLGVVLLLVALLGFIVPDSLMHTLVNTQGAGDPDNFLHLVSGALSLYFGTAGAEGTSRTATA